MQRVIISGGGTGGHIHPALALAEEILQRNPDVEILFVGANGRMEMERIPAAGHKIIGLPITGIDRKLSLRNLIFPWRLLRSVLKAHQILRSFRPDVAIGVGGFASGPLLWAAAKQGIPTVIQEQNSFPGITNRMMSGRADLICAGFPPSASCRRAIRCGIRLGRAVDRTRTRMQIQTKKSRETTLVSSPTGPPFSSWVEASVQFQ